MTPEEKLQAAIDSQPRDHKPLPYQVIIYNKKGKHIDIHYVRASSKHRAELTGLRVSRFTFGKRAAATAKAIPDGWKNSDIAKNGWESAA